MKRGNLYWPSAWFPSCRRSPTASIPGATRRTLYKKRNEIERLFRRLKGYRRIFSRFEKLDVVFLGFLSFAFIVEALR